MVESLHVQGIRAIQVYSISNSAHSQILNMRRLAAENSDYLIDLTLVFKGLQIMSGCKQVDLGGQLHGRMSPVTTSVNAKLTGIHQGLETFLGTLYFLIAVMLPIGETLTKFGRGLCISLCG